MIRTVKTVHSRSTPPPTEAVEGCDRFGFLPYATCIRFDGGAIAPVPNYADVRAWVERHLYVPNLARVGKGGWFFESGILFPPLSWRQQHDPVTDDPICREPESEAPATLFRVPASHYVYLDGVSRIEAEREGAAGFVTKLAGFVHDAPTQFHDWWFDAPASIGAVDLTPAPAVLEHFLSHAYSTWKDWPPVVQQLMISVLHMHARAPGHQWYWERFSWEYTVTDACFNVADIMWPDRFRANHKVGARRLPHGERLGGICEEFKIPRDGQHADCIKSIVSLRNELIHEARWGGHQPSTKGSAEAYRLPLFLHKLNQRLVVAILGYQNRFVSSSWYSLGRAGFDRMT